MTLLLASAAIPATARRGPPVGSAAWTRAQRFLTQPAPGLSAASDAWRRGDRLRAEWLLAEVASRHPVVRDHASVLRATILLELKRPHEVAHVIEEALQQLPSSPLLPELAALQGRALVATGDEDGARAAFRTALDATDDEELRASLLLDVAASQQRSGRAAEATETYTLLWYLYPLSEEASRAEAHLADVEARGGSARDASDWRRRADRLFRKRRNAEAIAAYDRALAGDLSKAEASRVRKQRAHTLFRLRLYPEASAAFRALPQIEDIPIWHARSLARAGRVEEAIGKFEALSRERGNEHALRARFLAALLLDGRGQPAAARVHLETLARDGVRSVLRDASLWRLSWAAYREARYGEAISLLDKLGQGDHDPIAALRTRYWRARSLEQLAALEAQPDAGRAAARAAAGEFEAIASAYPLTYYGWRARSRLPREARVPNAGAWDAPAAAASWPRELSHTLPTDGPRRLEQRDLARARILLEAGLRERAVGELERAAPRVGGLLDRLELAQLFHSAGSYRRAQRLVVDPYKETLARGPAPTLETLWWHAWPAAFAHLVHAATASPGSVEAALVLSIMREESGFRPTVVSPVGARGLLQIMEPTGLRLARAIGQADFTVDDLFEPRTNIALGAYYLRELSDRFDGRLSATIASYNAGPDAVSGWLAAQPDLDDDEWVESIPYEQTRSYVKRVLRSLEAYRLLY